MVLSHMWEIKEHSKGLANTSGQQNMNSGLQRKLHREVKGGLRSGWGYIGEW